MDISLDTVQNLAPDQASLNAAKKLLNTSKWPVRGQHAPVNTIWGQCQGSGSKPYYTVADPVDHGYKCTCPSRKFPCKHVLALLWQFSEGASEFPTEEPPEWVNDWLGRRRKKNGSTSETDTKVSKNDKNIALAGTTEKEKPVTPEEQAKRDAAKEKRAAQIKASTNASVSAGLIELQQWIDDQLRTGIGSFTKEVSERCRRIGARLVDAKATNLASRIDEIPAKIYALPPEQQIYAAFKELGQLILLSEAWFADENSPDVRRAIATAENRETVLNSESAERKQGQWETVGEKITTRRDGLIGHSTWLVKVDEKLPCFALLLDHYPASAGKREAGLSIGTQIQGELAFYPSQNPLRAILVDYQVITPESAIAWQLDAPNIWSNYSEMLKREPWIEQCPSLLNKGSILTDAHGNYWWQPATKDDMLPISNSQLPALLLGSDIETAFAIWNGESAELFSARTKQWGTIPC